ncbi:MAG TPA: Mur ligase family protein [Opitutaceae bacterium]|jgi:UDP-N-acetylmuramate: L-alanyl-gamma-D-glutamyl-meso-diaminopimelate ligase|nr:Mur ligase family protein [Opitutaceae bacterium]
MRLYFMGIGGTAMGNAALLLRQAGHEVLGADTAVYPPMSDVLRAAGIEVLPGFDPDRLRRLAVDGVVIGNAMTRGNPEVEWLLDARALPFWSLPEVLRRFVLEKRRNLVVCGTHGKTTTTSLAAFLLRENGQDPGFLIGGVPQDPPTGNHLGREADPFVIEGDEYDSAFFDKRSKFIHYAPRIAVLNNLEFDHADIFRDLADVQRTFSHLVRIVPRSGCVVMNGDDANLAALGPMPWTQVVRVGLGEGNDVRIAGVEESPAGVTFQLRWKGQEWETVRWSLPGMFNVRNAAMAATAAGLSRGADPRWLKLDSLTRFRGVKRRQEVRKAADGLTVVEDFGHHPTAIGETLRSLRARFPGAAVTAVFEPRSNTAARKTLQADFERALANADELYLGPVHRSQTIPEAERFNPQEVTAAVRARGRFAEHYPDNRALCDALIAATLPAGRQPRVVVFFSNGSFDGIIDRYCGAAG